MAEPKFKILIGSGGTFTPLSHQPALETLDETTDVVTVEPEFAVSGLGVGVAAPV